MTRAERAERAEIYTPFRDQHPALTDADARWLNEHMRLAGLRPWTEWARPTIAARGLDPWTST